MNEHHLVIAIIVISVLLIITLIFFIAREIISKNTKGTVFPEPEMQPAANKLADKSKSETESKKEHELEPPTKEPLYSAEHDIVLIEESQTNETVSLIQTDIYENLPQDSMLRRHYLTHLRAMIESLKPPHPTDVSLGRHYDSIITAEMEQCLSEKGAIERLIGNYENYKKTLAQAIQAPKSIAEPLLKAGISCEESPAQHETPKLPEDSMLRRHTMTHLYAIVESNMPLRPTDAVLRRHYDTMINYEVNKLLGNKVV
jgi:hypothetical protein